jgi:phosphopantetheinyl transferase (holo-ACP synthase)
LSITGEAQALVENVGASNIHISIAHTSEHAVAQVILEKPPE